MLKYLLAFLALTSAAFGQLVVAYTGQPGAIPVKVSASGGGNVTGSGTSAANDVACITNTNSTAIGPCKTGGFTVDPTTGDAAFPRNVAITGTLSSGSGGSTAGAYDMSAGTSASIGSNVFGIGAPATMTTSVRLESPNAVPVAHSLMVLGAPASNKATWTYKAVPDCPTGGLGFTQSTDVFGCNSISAGGGGVSGWTGTAVTIVSTVAQYTPFVGGGTTSGAGAESTVSVAAPAAATIANLKVSINAALGGSATFAVTLRDGASSTALTCTTASGGASCSDTTHSVNVAQGDLLDFLIVGTGTITAATPQISIAYTVGTTSVGVTSVGFTGGLISVATPTTTPAFTVAGTSGGIPYFASSSTWASSGALTASALVLGGGAGAAPTPLGSLGTTTTLLHGNAAGAPTFGAVSLTADVAGVLPTANIAVALANQTSLRGNAMAAAAGNATIGQVIATGNKALDFASTATGACATAITDTATGALSTDRVIFNANADISGVTGYIPASTGGGKVDAYPSTDLVTFKWCNWTAGTVDPGSITVNWMVIR